MDANVDHGAALQKIRTAETISMSPELFEKLYLSPPNKVHGHLRTTVGNPTPLYVYPLLFISLCTHTYKQRLDWLRYVLDTTEHGSSEMARHQRNRLCGYRLPSLFRRSLNDTRSCWRGMTTNSRIYSHLLLLTLHSGLSATHSPAWSSAPLRRSGSASQPRSNPSTMHSVPTHQIHLIPRKA
jgi:hypothetical protein